VGIQDLSGATADRFDGSASPVATGTREPGEHDADREVAGESVGHDAARAPGGTDRSDWLAHQRAAPVARGTQDGIPAQKKSIHAIERDTEINRRRREAFVTELRTVPSEHLIYLDESGVSTQMTRLYGRCRGGRRVTDAVPGGDWKIITILGALNHNGMLAAMTIEAATDREIFLTFLDDVLCPKLRPGDVLVMDNLSAHKVEGVRQRVEATGARLLYLPPYSPDLNPIEKAWAKIKALLRNVQARSPEKLHSAIANLLPKIQHNDATAWFRLPFTCIATSNLLY